MCGYLYLVHKTEIMIQIGSAMIYPHSSKKLKDKLHIAGNTQACHALPLILYDLVTMVDDFIHLGVCSLLIKMK